MKAETSDFIPKTPLVIPITKHKVNNNFMLLFICIKNLLNSTNKTNKIFITKCVICKTKGYENCNIYFFVASHNKSNLTVFFPLFKN